MNLSQRHSLKKKARQNRSRRAPHRRLQLESLEGRTLLAGMSDVVADPIPGVTPSPPPFEVWNTPIAAGEFGNSLLGPGGVVDQNGVAANEAPTDGDVIDDIVIDGAAAQGEAFVYYGPAGAPGHPADDGPADNNGASDDPLPVEPADDDDDDDDNEEQPIQLHPDLFDVNADDGATVTHRAQHDAVKQVLERLFRLWLRHQHDDRSGQQNSDGDPSPQETMNKIAREYWLNRAFYEQNDPADGGATSNDTDKPNGGILGPGGLVDQNGAEANRPDSSESNKSNESSSDGDSSPTNEQAAAVDQIFADDENVMTFIFPPDTPRPALPPLYLRGPLDGIIDTRAFATCE